MPVDYDLVILGGTAIARRAALQAVGYGARVALVEPPGLFEAQQRQKYLLKGLQQLGETRQRLAAGEVFGLSAQAAGGRGDQELGDQELGDQGREDQFGEHQGGKLDWQAVFEWVAIAAETQVGHLSVDVLNISGVDVVLEMPQRLTSQLTVTTESRQLSARGILAAFGQLPTVIETLESAQKRSKASSDVETRQGESICIVGGSPESVEWALALRDCGVAVELVARTLLPAQDKDIRRLMRSHLLASGIRICSEINQKSNREKSNRESHLQIDPIRLDSMRPALDLPDFIALNKNRYLTNRYLQTNHPRIFASGSILGGSTDEALARYEADIAVRNALFWSSAEVNYELVPQGYSQYGQVGLTETQAEKHYGSAVQILITSDANSACLTRVNPNPYYCKLVCLHDQLIGAHLFGRGAGDCAALLASQLGQSVCDLDIAVEDTLLRLVKRGAKLPRQAKWQPNCWRRDWAENWFNWRRSR